VAARAGGCCEYCWSQASFSTQAFSVEHIVPLEKDGQTALDNLALAVEALHLNRESLVKLRRVLYAIGEHPPPASSTDSHPTP
jgi:5-methylcytosine-specific restriction endonuclease McrA